MALIEKIKAIADAIREKTGSSGLLTLDEMPEMIAAMDAGSGAVTLDNTYILVDEDGYEIPAVLTEEEVVLTATAASDIRIGTTAVTDEGVVTGEKEIPAYITREGRVRISPGNPIVINLYSIDYQYTKLQALLCEYNTNIANSVSTIAVVIDDSVYDVSSIDAKSTVTSDATTQSINLGLVNDSDDYLVVRYMTIREEP